MAIARAEEKPLGHILVERGIVRPHSIAMALADQHGGPLKTEYGFAAGSGARSAPGHAGEPPSSPPPLLLLAPMGEVPASPLPQPPVAPVPAAPAPVLPALRLPAIPAPPERIAEAPLTTTSVVLNATLEAETAARAAAELEATNLLARIDELEAAEASLRSHLAAERTTGADAVTAAEALRAELAGLNARDQTEAAAVAAADQQLAAVRDQLAEALAEAEALRAQIAAEQSASEHAATTVETLRTQLHELQSSQVADAAAASAAASAAEEALAAVRDQLTEALAVGETVRAQINAERSTNEHAATSVETLRTQLHELQSSQVADAAAASAAALAAEEALGAVRDQLAEALAEAEALRAHIAAEQSTNEHAATSVETLRTQLHEIQGRQVADAAAASAAEEALAATRDQLATAVADGETLRAVIAIDHAAREQAEAAASTLRAQVDELQAKDAAESLARSSAEEQLETMRRELEHSLAQAETSSRELDAERDASTKAAAAADELRARVTELETELRKARVSVVPPVHPEIDELRAVIELQEQALAAVDMRERRRPLAGSERTRSYAQEAHLLFALNADGYELLERSGPAPAVGSIVELSEGRTCRVLRVGPSPFPGAQEACAYLELA